MSSLDWGVLLGDTSHAFEPLFKAYDTLLREGDAWLDKELADFDGDREELRKVFDGVQRGNVYAVATCIAVLASNISRFYAARVLGNEHEATRFGTEVDGVRFGEILRVAGNAARHNPPTHQTTLDTLKTLGIKRLDDSVPFELLERAGIRTYEDLIRELDILAHHIDYEHFQKTYDPANPPKLEPWMMPFNNAGLIGEV